MIKTLILWFVGLFVLCFVSFILLDIDHQSIQQQNLKETLLPYRLGFYVLVVAGWPWVAKGVAYLRATKQSERIVDPEEFEQRVLKEVKALEALRWKVLLFFVGFEVLAVQTLWLG